MYSIIFICTGNICRSPMAEGVLRKKCSELNRTDIAVSSMGIHARDGFGASELAIQVCKKEGIDISEHKSRMLVPDELVKSDLVLVMEPLHLNYIYTFFPIISKKTFLLGSWPGENKAKGAIQDPIGVSIKVYSKIYKEITAHIDRILPTIQTRFPKQEESNKTPSSINM